MNTPRCLRSSTVLQVRDVVASAEFYENKLGFTQAGMWGDPPCFCIVGRDNVTIFLDQSRNGAVPHNQYWAAYIYVDRVDAVHQELSSRGVEIVRGLEDMPHGCREFDIHDSDGHLIAFGQYLEPSPQGPGL